MSRFNNTVAKLASSPVKQELLPVIPRLLKTAAIDWSDVMGGIAKSVGATAITASGAGLAAAIQSKLRGHPQELEAKHQEHGKLKARSDFQSQTAMQLKPIHNDVIKSVLKDDIIRKADKKTMESAYQTMRRFAPHLAADENATLSFLREHAIYGTGPSYASLKNLAEAEKAVTEAGGSIL